MTFLCQFDDVPEGGAKSLDGEDETLFAVKRDGQLFVYRNSCPHLGVELNWLEDQFLDMDGALIQCATHGALFTIETGECVAGPCYGQALQPVAVDIRDGEVHSRDD